MNDLQTSTNDEFEAQRSRLRAIAVRMLASSAEADDVLQEAWIRFDRTDRETIDNLPAWLTTVVTRLCLDHLRSRASRGETAIEDSPEVVDEELTPEEEIELADAIGAALTTTLETLSPPERLAFVLHDSFTIPFADVARVIGCSPDAARQHASRARRRVRGAQPETTAKAPDEVVNAFITASRAGDFEALINVLDPSAVLRTDKDTPLVKKGEPQLGGKTVADFFAGKAQGATRATIDGAAGMVWEHNGKVRVAFEFIVVDGRIAAVEMVCDSKTLEQMEFVTTE
jgi:RNA polymerase sigma-70 factor (ECF subfamily)